MARTPDCWPTELVLKLFEELPAKDMQRCRRVCKKLKAIVDDSQIKEQLSNLIKERQIPRLQAYVDKYINYADKPAFLDKLARWLEVRGVWTKVTPSILNECEAISDEDSDYEDSDADETDSNGEVDDFNPDSYRKSVILFTNHLQQPPRTWLTWALINLHIARWKESSNDHICPRREFVQRYNFLAFDANDIGEMYDKVCGGTQPYLSTDFREPPRVWDAELPTRNVTSLESGCQRGSTGICPYTVARDTFSLPEIPRSGIWAYCLPGGSVWRYVQGELRSAVHPKNFDALLVAAVYEEIFIF